MDPDRAIPGHGRGRPSHAPCRCRHMPARDEMPVHLGGRRRDLGRHVSPATVAVVSVGQLDRAGAVSAPGIDVGASSQQLIDDIDLTRHYGPMDRLVRRFVAGVKQFRRLIEQAPDLAGVQLSDRRSHCVAGRGGTVDARIDTFQTPHFGIPK